MWTGAVLILDRRMKCLEFLYFYLMDETTHDGSGASPIGLHSTPSTPVTTQVHGSTRPFGPKIFARPVSGTSSLSFGSSILSSTLSKSAFSVALKSSQSSVQSVRTPSLVKKSYSMMSMPDPSTPPSSPPGGKRIPRATSTRPMLLLQKDVDYEPQSPRKSRVCVSDEFTRRDSREGGERVLTTEEKKEILGTLLGNVDALVEGVRKAGIWGLT